MGKHIVKWSYWLGAAFAVLALLSRGLNVLGVNFLVFSTKGNIIGYHTYMDGAVFFLIISIAAANYAQVASRQHQP